MKMAINIGNNNEINESIIGNGNKKEKNKSKENIFIKVIAELLIAVIGGLIVGYFIYKFGWNK